MDLPGPSDYPNEDILDGTPEYLKSKHSPRTPGLLPIVGRKEGIRSCASERVEPLHVVRLTTLLPLWSFTTLRGLLSTTHFYFVQKVQDILYY